MDLRYMGTMAISVSVAVARLMTNRKESKRDLRIATEGRSPGRATTKGRLELNENIVTSFLDLFLHAQCRYLASRCIRRQLFCRAT